MGNICYDSVQDLSCSRIRPKRVTNFNLLFFKAVRVGVLNRKIPVGKSRKRWEYTRTCLKKSTVRFWERLKCDRVR
jgi:hypothetical protein